VADFNVEVGSLALVPHKNAADELKLAPGILLTNDGGEAHGEQVFLRGFDAREGQDIEFSVQGVPINEAGNLHGNGYADTHFILPELILGLRVLEGPFDPRQGDFAVAGSVDYELGYLQGGVTAKYQTGSFGTRRAVLLWGPGGGRKGTFAGAELYETDGYGQNRDGRRGTVMAQYETSFGANRLQVGASAYSASFHSAGVIREDDYRAGRICFFCTYDPRQGEETSRYAAWLGVESHFDGLVVDDELFAIVRPMRLRENFTGFLLDVQEPQQSQHVQRGDLLDLDVLEYTVGARGSARVTGSLLDLRQELDVGYFARGDLVHGQQSRIEAATGHPYHVDTDLDSRQGDFGLYADANLRPLSWVTLRGGGRAELLTYDLDNNCAVQSVAHASHTNPPGDVSCLDQQDFGAHREPFQRAQASGVAILPRATLEIGPFYGLSAAAAYGKGVRAIDPIYVVPDTKTPFASATSIDAGLAWKGRAANVDLNARSSWFRTRVDQDLVFSESAGRNTLGGASTRDGVVGAVRATGRFFDVSTNVTWVHATFDDNGLLIPYVPDLVFRFDGALFGDLPFGWARILDRPLRGSLASGITYVAPRPLPYGEESDPVFTIDGSASLGWSAIELGVEVSNVLDTRYKLGEYDYTSDFHSGDADLPALVPTRHFTPGAPRTVLFDVTVHLGGAS
jgi:hypothetical protein